MTPQPPYAHPQAPRSLIEREQVIRLRWRARPTVRFQPRDHRRRNPLRQLVEQPFEPEGHGVLRSAALQRCPGAPAEAWEGDPRKDLGALVGARGRDGTPAGLERPAGGSGRYKGLLPYKRLARAREKEIP